MGRKLVVYMIDGKAYGPRTAEIGNWSGKAIFSPRANIDKIISRDEFTNQVFTVSDPTLKMMPSKKKYTLVKQRKLVIDLSSIWVARNSLSISLLSARMSF